MYIDTNTIDKEKLIHGLTLKIFNLSTKPSNYRILKMLPSDVKSIMKEIKINKQNTNVRITQLEKVGLVRRDRGLGKVYSTTMSENVIGLMELIKKCQNLNMGFLWSRSNLQ